MNGKARVAAAMRLERPERVPVMTQLALGHYFLHVALPNEDIWFSAEAFSEALLTITRRYGFDGVLVNLLPAPPDWRQRVDRVEQADDGTRTLYWKTGSYCVIPPDDNLHSFPEYRPPSLEEVDPEAVYYLDPHGPDGLKYPFYFGLEPETRDADDFFPDYLFRTLDLVKAEAGEELSIHAEYFSPFTQLMDLFGYENALMGLVTEAGKCHAILDRLAAGASDLAQRQARRGVDAVLCSSAFAGAGFISRDYYREFVMPYEARVVGAVKAIRPDLPVYVHTCGAIGDRLEMMTEAGYDGVDTLDPPPLGNVELANAVERLKGKAFIKGNMDAVNTLLRGDVETVRRDARMRVETAGPNGGYILSSACSVAPRVDPANLRVLVEVAEQYGRFQ